MPDVTANGSRIARSAAAAPAGRYEGTFSADDLAHVRRLAEGQGRHAGLGPRRLSDFVLAVNEVATNAIRHGCQRARLRLWTTPNGVHCEVHGGRWISEEHPSAIRLDDTDSLRLWLVWQICSDVALSHGPDGTTVRLSMDAA
jgi:serine/threonine-protein kinase RsbW